MLTKGLLTLYCKEIYMSDLPIVVCALLGLVIRNKSFQYYRFNNFYIPHLLEDICNQN